MRRAPRLRVIFFLPILAALQLWLCCVGAGRAAVRTSEPVAVNSEQALKRASENRALQKADSMLPSLKAAGYNASLFFVGDLTLPMDIRRFYVIDADSHRILHRFLMAHGSGGGSTIDSAVLSNRPGSLCSSPGRYLLGDTFWGQYGKGYRLLGLDATNSNALSRLIVFHYYLPQTSHEHDYPLYFSSGCPLLSHADFQICDALLSKTPGKKMMVLYR